MPLVKENSTRRTAATSIHTAIAMYIAKITNRMRQASLRNSLTHLRGQQRHGSARGPLPPDSTKQALAWPPRRVVGLCVHRLARNDGRVIDAGSQVLAISAMLLATGAVLLGYAFRGTQ